MGLAIAVVVATVLEFGAFFQLLVPITPPDRLHAAGLDAKNEVFADSVGWDDVANQVTTIYGELPASERTKTVIVTASRKMLAIGRTPSHIGTAMWRSN